MLPVMRNEVSQAIPFQSKMLHLVQHKALERAMVSFGILQKSGNAPFVSSCDYFFFK